MTFHKGENGRAGGTTQERWRELGFSKKPKTNSTALHAMTAKRWFEKLACHQEMRGLLLAGRRATEVARIIREERKQGLDVDSQTAWRYVATYANWFLHPFEAALQVASSVGTKAMISADRISPEVAAKLRRLPAQAKEIDWLENAAVKQWERIAKQMELESSMQVPLPNLRLEIETYLKVCQLMIEKQVQLGYPGYQEMPQKIDLTGQINTARIEMLTPEEKKRVIEFGRQVMRMIELSRGKSGVYQAEEPEEGNGLAGEELPQANGDGHESGEED